MGFEKAEMRHEKSGLILDEVKAIIGGLLMSEEVDVIMHIAY